MQELKLTLELPQSINKIYRKSQYGIYMTAEGKAYKNRMIEYVAMEALHQNWTKVENKYLFLDEVVYMNKKGRDSDNLKKLTQDVITECNLVWTDDTYCLPRTRRIYIDRKNPRIEIVLTPTEFIGIFDNQNEHNQFIKKCETCKQYKRYGINCSILKDSLDNVITDNVVNGVCLKHKK